MNCLSVFDHFVGLALKGLRGIFRTLLNISDEIFLKRVRKSFEKVQESSIIDALRSVKYTSDLADTQL